MVKLELLSPNLIIILEELLKNQNLCKLLYCNNSTPLSQSDLENTKILMFKNLFPYPFDINIETEDCSQLRVYYPDGRIKNKIIGDMEIYFDIIVAKNLWLVNDGSPKIRPYEIMKEIIFSLDDKSISTIGKLHFNRFRHIFINEKFNCVRLSTPMLTIEKNNKF